jgi:putative holliday junction resolvase
MFEDHTLYNKKFLSLDWGEKFIGVATFHIGRDPMILCWGRLKGGSFDEVWTQLEKLIADEFIDAVVVGVPFFTDGKAGSTTHKIKDFLAQLLKVCPLRIYEQDETLSTFEAEQRMKNSPKYNFQVKLSEIDALCASIILEDFLRTQGISL